MPRKDFLRSFPGNETNLVGRRPCCAQAEVGLGSEDVRDNVVAEQERRSRWKAR
jgi:hypothetical protein